MNLMNISLVNWGNGAFIITFVFALVVLILVGAVLLMMFGDKKKKKLN